MLVDSNREDSLPLAKRREKPQTGMGTPERGQWAPCNSGRHSKGGGCVSWADVRSFLDMASALPGPTGRDGMQARLTLLTCFSSPCPDLQVQLGIGLLVTNTGVVPQASDALRAKSIANDVSQHPCLFLRGWPSDLHMKDKHYINAQPACMMRPTCRMHDQLQRFDISTRSTQPRLLSCSCPTWEAIQFTRRIISFSCWWPSRVLAPVLPDLLDPLPLPRCADAADGAGCCKAATGEPDGRL